MPIRKAKQESVTILKPSQDNEWIISGGWGLAETSKVIVVEQSLFNLNYNTSNWYNATVPGTVHTTLLDQGLYPDPYIGLNNLPIPDLLCRVDWGYRTTFKLPKVSNLNFRLHRMVNYDSHRAIFKSWNSKMWNNPNGLLLWMTHPAWPSTVWQVYSWDYETFGFYFGSKKACEPVHVQINLRDNKVIVDNSSLDYAIGIKLNLCDAETKDLILPA